MGERRSLTAAIKQTPEVDPDAIKSFVTQDVPHERPVSKPAIAFSDERQEAATPSPMQSVAKKPRRKPSRLQPVGLIPVTVRLKPEIAGALKRASLERQLDGEEVFSQQDLVETALEPWLQENGYI